MKANIPALKEGSRCPNCVSISRSAGEHPVGKLDLVYGNEPYSEDHLMCPVCESTYHLEENVERKAIRKLSGYICPKCRTLLSGRPPKCRRCNQKLTYSQDNVNK